MIENKFYPGLSEVMNESDFEFDLGEENDPKEEISDASPRTLYIKRKVLNHKEISKWYSDQGVVFEEGSEDFHVTIIHSTKEVDWMKMGQPWEAKLEIPEGGPRLHEKFGDEQDCVVLLFKSSELDWRHQTALRIGAVSSYTEYQSHITLYKSSEEISKLKPYQGKIILGPEIFEEVDEDAKF